MQHQYWVTKKSVLRKLGSKEDECIISSDAELDAKLELFKSINENCLQLQRVIDLYQERLCYLAQEENTLGRYLKECGKNEKNSSAGQLLSTAGKALSYVGHQRLAVRPPLVRLHHEVDTFRNQAIVDTKHTISEMEKSRTEYRAALSWMKSASAQLDPDTGHGLEKFRKAQSYVKTTKSKFDRFTLACLQKVDLLAAARCNMFSHALIPYQSTLVTFSTKAGETLTLALTKLKKVEPYDFNVVAELAVPLTPNDDKDKNTFFNAEYTDEEQKGQERDEELSKTKNIEISSADTSNLLGEDFSLLEECSTSSDKDIPNITDNDTSTSSAFLDLTSWPPNTDYLSGEFMPSRLMQEGSFSFTAFDLDKLENRSDNVTNSESKEFYKAEPKENSKTAKEKSETQVSWLSLFAELDPLANQDASIRQDSA